MTPGWPWSPWKTARRPCASTPGNIGGDAAIDRVVNAAKAHGVCIRVGANSGSLPKDIAQKHGGPCPEALVESALRHVKLLEDRGFEAVKVSLKSSSVLDTIAAYRLYAAQADHPLHLASPRRAACWPVR